MQLVVWSMLLWPNFCSNWSLSTDFSKIPRFKIAQKSIQQQLNLYMQAYKHSEVSLQHWVVISVILGRGSWHRHSMLLSAMRQHQSPSHCNNQLRYRMPLLQLLWQLQTFRFLWVVEMPLASATTILGKLPHSCYFLKKTRSKPNLSMPFSKTVSFRNELLSEVKVKSKLSYNRQPVVQSVWCQVTIWGPWPIFFLLEILFRQLWVSYHGALSLTRGRACNLQLLVGLVSTVPLRSAFHRAHDECKADGLNGWWVDSWVMISQKVKVM
jgi:hypothetical protein